MSKKRVVITGFGTVNPIGNTVEEYWDGLVNGRSGIGQIEAFDTTGFSTTIGAEVKNLDLEQYFEPG